MTAAPAFATARRTALDNRWKAKTAVSSVDTSVQRFKVTSILVVGAVTISDFVVWVMCEMRSGGSYVAFRWGDGDAIVWRECGNGLASGQNTDGGEILIGAFTNVFTCKCKVLCVRERRCTSKEVEFEV
jgi:hypothetical protein